MNLSERDKRLIWHPFTQEKNAGLPIAIKKAEGLYVYDENGKKYLDLISSWWVNLHGHANQYIAKSIYEQALKLEHVIFAGFTHEPAVDLCEKLIAKLPVNLEKFFFSDNGSTSTEIALKMAYQYWYNQGEVKRLFLTFDGSYHGDTFGAMSVGKTGFHNHFKTLFFETLIVPYPETYNNDHEVEKKEEDALNVLNNYLLKYKNQISAMILEPLIQGASGMRTCRSKFLNKLMERLKENNILIIFDEVMTGFGRTGTLFALEQLNISPDFLCISKGITGGFLPLALTITTNKIYEAFLHDDWEYAFAHGHSYTANPLACSAAIASFKLTIEALNNNKLQDIEDIHKDGLIFLKKECPNITKSRNLGTIAAFDLENMHTIANQLKQQFLEHELLVRPLKNTVYLLPPYIIKKEELLTVYEKLAKIIQNVS